LETKKELTLILVIPHTTIFFSSSRPLILYTTTTGIAIPPFIHTGWLFLFAVLMAAVLLFTMVFFVSCPSQLKSSQAGRVSHPGQEWRDLISFDRGIHDSYVHNADI
jgi:hypothetical protein